MIQEACTITATCASKWDKVDALQHARGDLRLDLVVVVEGDGAAEEVGERGLAAVVVAAVPHVRVAADLGSKRVIQRRFNVSVPRARVPEKASTLRDRSER